MSSGTQNAPTSQPRLSHTARSTPVIPSPAVAAWASAWVAASRAARRRSARTRSEMSRRYAVKRGGPSVSMGVMANSTGNSAPPARTAVSSSRLPSTAVTPVARKRVMPLRWAARMRGGTINSPMSCPSTSARR